MRLRRSCVVPTSFCSSLLSINQQYTWFRLKSYDEQMKLREKRSSITRSLTGRNRVKLSFELNVWCLGPSSVSMDCIDVWNAHTPTSTVCLRHVPYAMKCEQQM